MPIRNLRTLQEWGERENPPYRLWRLVEQWVLRLDGRPWQAPSEPLTESVGQATEVRVAEVPDSEGIEVFYEHEHESGLVTILLIAQRGSSS